MIKAVYRLLVWVAVFAISTYVKAQSVKAPQRFETEAGGYVSSAPGTPFWHQTNQFGIVPTRTPALTLRGAAYADYDTAGSEKRKVDYGYGVRVVGNISNESRLILPELYIKARVGAFEAYVGRRQEIYGLVDTTLSSGAYSWSGNSLPLPRIQISVPKFTAVPFTKGWVSFMGTFGHAWMNPTGFVNHAMLHQKTLYLRIGRPQDVVRVYGGFTHQAVWGGEIDDISQINNPSIALSSKLPSRFRDYLYVVTGVRLGQPDKDSTLANFDYTNRVGNHLGTVDVGADIDLATYSLFLYRQSVYDDGSLYYLTNIADGLNGIRLRRNDENAILRDVLVEFLNTTSQGGGVFDLTTEDPNARGRDDYFNHAQFRDGWSYRQRGIGTPFITPALGPNGEWPRGIFTNNNRVKVLHVGMAGSLPVEQVTGWADRLRYQAKFSYSRNFGTYGLPFRHPREQFSGFISLDMLLAGASGLSVTSSVAIDAGELYRNNIGLYVGLRKVWYKNQTR